MQNVCNCANSFVANGVRVCPPCQVVNEREHIHVHALSLTREMALLGPSLHLYGGSMNLALIIVPWAKCFGRVRCAWHMPQKVNLNLIHSRFLAKRRPP